MGTPALPAQKIRVF